MPVIKNYTLDEFQEDTNLNTRENQSFALDSLGRVARRVIVVQPLSGSEEGPNDIIMNTDPLEVSEGQPSGTVISTFTVTGGTAPIVTTVTDDPAGAVQIVGNEIQTSRALTLPGDGTFSFTLTATDANLNTYQETFLVTTVAAAGFQNDLSYEFSGNGFILVDNTLYAAQNGMTWFAWVKGSQTASIQNIFDSKNNSNDGGARLELLDTADAHDFRLTATRATNGNSLIYRYDYPVGYNEATWNLISFSVTTDDIELYINGQLQTPATIDSTTGSLADVQGTRAYIGSNEDGTADFFTGKIDEIGYCTTVLSNAKLILLYNNGV
jgi:hypothetical protein